MNIAAYAYVLFLTLPRYNANIIDSKCQKSGCPAGLFCADDNYDVCNNSRKILNCHCKPVLDKERGLIVTCSKFDNWPANDVISTAIEKDGYLRLHRIWSHEFSTNVKFLSVDVDNKLKQAYFYDSKAKQILKNPNYYNGPSAENKWTTLHIGLSDASLKLAVDWVSHNIYWTDPIFKWIMVQSLLVNDTSMFRVLIDENLEGPCGLALDAYESLLFWSDVGTFTKIEVSSLSGGNRRTLLFSNILMPYGMAADHEDRRLYFVDARRSTVETITYEGADRKIVTMNRNKNYFDITVYKDYLYVVERNNDQLSVINKKNGNELEKTVQKEVSGYYAVAVFHNDIPPSPVTDHCLNYGCEHICLTEKNGAVCTCKDGYSLNQDMKKCSVNSKYFHRGLVYSNDSSICIVDIRVLSDFVFDPVCVLESTGTKYMVMDTDQRRIMIANDSAIYWTSVDNFELHQLTEISGTISGMAWDGYGRDLYWTEVGSGIIKRMSIETCDVEVFQKGLTNPRDILILPHNRLVYWISDNNGSTIESSKIDSSNLHVVLKAEDLTHWKSLSYDQYQKRIYFLSTSPNNEAIVTSCKHDGSDRKAFLSTKESYERLEIFKGYLMVTAKDTKGTLIMSYRIHDAIRTTSGVFTGTGAISDIKVYDENNRQNETGPCFNLNGECEQVCIASGKSRICQCTFGFNLAGDRKTCLSDPIEDNFMLVGDNSAQNIYQVSLNDQRVQGIKAKGTMPMYNPVLKRVIWRTIERNTLYSMHLNGSGKKQFSVSGLIYFTDVDYSTGNIYYTAQNMDTYLFYISVLSPDGKHIVLCDELSHSNGLVVYPSVGYMFYRDDHSLVRITMDGQQSEILHDNLFNRRGLTVDYKNGYLYWIDIESTYPHHFSVEYCKPDGTNHNTLTVIKRDVLGDYVLRDLDVYEDYLFLASYKQSRLMKLNISKPSEVTEFTVDGKLGMISDIRIYSSKAQNKNAFCSDHNGCCSTFCLPVPGGGVCACEDGVAFKKGSTTVCSNMTDGL